ncbi:MAG TPA: protease inhibitor I9 family protein, partial [Mycobacteriales bacterium]|nr:protease inhibitor I9 family protein [Mycobacteriales bacterium]
MSLHRRFGRNRPLKIVLSGAVAAAVTAVTVGTAGAAGTSGTGPQLVRPGTVKSATYQAGTYIVQLAGDPVTTYRGGQAGLPRTAPQPGHKIDPQSSAAQAYRRHLASQRQHVLDTIPGAKRIYSYDTAFNGFAADLTGAQAT